MFKQKKQLFIVSLCLWMGATPLYSQTIPPATPELEASLLAVLTSNAPYVEKASACRQLATVGTAKSVPVLANLMTDEKLSHMARYALETNPDAAVDRALREVLKKVQGKRLVGVIGSLGVRRDEQAVKPLVELMQSRDAEVRRAAMRALGSIGNTSAIQALQTALSQASTEQQVDLYEGLLRSAEVQAGQGHTEASLAIYNALREAKTPHQVRSAAIRGAIVLYGPGNLTVLHHCLSSSDYAVVSAAVSASLELTDQKITQALTSGLEDRSTDQQVLIIGVLGLRGDPTGIPGLHEMAKQAKRPARLAALKALSQMGDASTVPLLVTLTGDTDKEIAQAAANHLAHYPHPSADAAIRKMLESNRVPMRLTALELAGQRRMATTLPILLQAAADPDLRIRTQSLKTIAELGGSDELLALLVILPQMTETKDLDAMRQALTDIAARTDDPDACVAQLVNTLSQVNAAQKVALLRVLSSVGGVRALAAVRKAVEDSDEQVRLGAIRALGTWRSADAAPELLALVKTSQDTKIRTLCLRGYLTLAGRSDLPLDQRLGMCKQIAPYIQQSAEKKQWLGVLGRLDSPKALQQILPHFEDSEVKDTACAVSIAMIERLAKKNRQITKNPTVKQTLQKVVDVSTNAAYRKRAQSLLSAT